MNTVSQVRKESTEHKMTHLSPQTRLLLPENLLDDSPIPSLLQPNHLFTSPEFQFNDQKVSLKDLWATSFQNSEHDVGLLTSPESNVKDDSGLRLVTKYGTNVVVRDPALVERLLLKPLRRSVLTALRRWLRFSDQNSLLRLVRLCAKLEAIWLDQFCLGQTSSNDKYTWIDYVAAKIEDGQEFDNATSCLLAIRQVNALNARKEHTTEEEQKMLKNNPEYTCSASSPTKTFSSEIDCSISNKTEIQSQNFCDLLANKTTSSDEKKANADNDNDDNDDMKLEGCNILTDQLAKFSLYEDNDKNNNCEDSNEDEDDDDGVEVGVPNLNLLDFEQKEPDFLGLDKVETQPSYSSVLLRKLPKNYEKSDIELDSTKANLLAWSRLKVKQVPSKLIARTLSEQSLTEQDSIKNGRSMKVHLRRERPTLMDAAFNIRYKTELCLHHLTSADGTCPAAEDCHFAHGPEELRIPPVHPKYKTKYCSHYVETNGAWCPYGAGCYFKHSLPQHLKSKLNMKADLAEIKKQKLFSALQRSDRFKINKTDLMST